MASLRLALKASIKEANLPESQLHLPVPDLDGVNQRKQKRSRAPSSPTAKSEKAEPKRKRSLSEMSTDSAPAAKKAPRVKKTPKQEDKSDDAVEPDPEMESSYEPSVHSDTAEVVLSTLHDIETAIIKEEKLSAVAEVQEEDSPMVEQVKEEMVTVKEEVPVSEPEAQPEPQPVEIQAPVDEQQEEESEREDASEQSDNEIPDSLLTESYRVSSRAAAVAAKTKITERKKYRSRTITEEALEDTPKRKKRAYNMNSRPRGAKKEAKMEETTAEALPPVAEWVQCDTCSKWRKLPLDVTAASLPDQWYCSMNEWDAERNTCDADEEVAVEPPVEELPVKVDGRYGPRPRNYRRKKTIAVEEDIPDTQVIRRRRSEIEDVPEPAPASVAAPTIEKVDWVQCNKCGKWRKVPREIFLQGMPDAWYCAMNTWAQAFARCAAKEEVDEKPDESAPEVRSGLGRGKYIRKSKHTSQATSVIINGVPVTKKVTEWVQCERKNCQKWRKVPPHIDLSSLPPKWYCEMNTWDTERATCDGPEESDSDTEQPITSGTRSQLIMGNSKGPGTLSYRRLIFGSDGRIRPAYSEKNKNGYGIFSHTEAHRPSDADEYVMPTRKVGYWWSSAYDEDGAVFTTSSRQRYNINGPTGPRKAVKDEEPVAHCISKPKEKLHERACLIEAAMRMQPQKIPLPPKKKHAQRLNLTSLQRRLVQRTIVHNCLLTPHPTPNHVVKYTEIVKAVATAYFPYDPVKEACRSEMSVWEIKQALRSLEELNLVEATYNNDFELCFRLLGSPVGTVAENKFVDISKPKCEDNPERIYPLKMRKNKLTIVHISSSESSSEESESDEDNDEGSTVDATEKSCADIDDADEGNDEDMADETEEVEIEASGNADEENGDDGDESCDEEVINEVSFAVDEAVMSSNESGDDCEAGNQETQESMEISNPVKNEEA